MNELSGDQKRQAVPTINGFASQIWQSLFRWVSLDETELIFLEGAEDIDLLGPNQTETIQVKTSSDNITLNSSAVQEAILNYWKHRNANPNIQLLFRLLTTSERGLERSRPFGDRRGLDVWDSCKRPSEDLIALRDFLAKQPFLTPELRLFIKDAGDEQLRTQLITRIEWDTGTQTQPYVEAAVIRKVSGYGDRAFNLPQSESEKVIPHLLNHVWNTVRKEKDRWLDLPAFRRIFEDTIAEKIPRSELANLRRSAVELAQLKGHFGSAGEPRRGIATLPPISVLTTLTPVINNRFLRREELVTEYKVKLNSFGLLVLKGSTGMGKSTLANNVALAMPGAWRRLDLRGLKPEEIADRLDYAAFLVEDQRLRIDCLVDDINFDREPLVYENALGRFIYAVRNVNGRIIISTQASLPTRIVNVYELPSLCSVQVPVLSEDEVNQLCINYGCTEDRFIATWSRFIYLGTRGHPLLAHARVRGLEARGWPAPTADDMLAAPDIDDVRREIRNRLRDSLPSEDARVLLYRLSILTHFRKHQAVCLGKHSPSIQLSGEILDSLTGPWVEPVDGTRFRLSPLLDNAASEVFNPSEIKQLHAVAAESYLPKGRIDVTDFNAMLLHGLLGQAVDPIRAAVMGFIQVPATDWAELSRVIDWFAHFAVTDDTRIFPDPYLNALLRQMQFRTAAARKVDLAVKIADICLREMNELDDPHPDTKRSMQITFLSNALFSLDVPFSIETVVSYLLHLMILLRDSTPFFSEAPDYEPAREADMRAALNAEVSLSAVVGRCRSASTALQFLRLLAERSPEETKEVWEILTGNDYLAMMLVDQIWLDEARQTTPNWSLCIERLEQVTEIGRSQNALALVSAGYRAKAIVLEEYLKDTAAAAATLAEGTETLGIAGVFLDEYRAKALFLEGQFEAALTIWRKVLPILEQQQQLGRTYVYRDAEMCAAKIGNWQEAANFAQAGQNAANQLLLNVPKNLLERIADTPIELKHQQVLANGFKADYAFAMWKAGDKAEAIQQFAEILNAFESLPSPTEDVKSNMLYRRVGHAISWLMQEDDPEAQPMDPPAGFFSNAEVIEELRNTPIEPVSLLWYLLAKVEYKFQLDDAIFKRFEAEVAKTGLLREKIGYRDLKMSHALRKLEVADLVPDLLSHFVDLEEFASSSQLERGSASLELIKVLFAALTKLMGVRKFHSAPLARWRKDATNSELLDESIVAWLDFIEGLECADTNILLKTVRDSSAPPENRLAASLVASTRTDIDPENRFYANALITITELNTRWRTEIEETIANLVVTGWTRVVETERFAIKSPALHSPAILSACHDSTTRGLVKAARILLAARHAVTLQISGSELETLWQLSGWSD